MRRVLLEVFGVILIIISLAFFYKSLGFLSTKDYVSGILSILAGFSIIRVGVEVMEGSGSSKD